ncbi:hypothetical protein [Dokdonia sinensis]|uniref:hypothetical protein n=1 Tax=Dokdonia sinensis TaxID=2479847 RepID=UPI0011C3D5B1|nr:hypothetical protein [Dokdonia sinensis]
MPDLTCKDFKTGEFYIPSLEPNVEQYIVYRELGSQTEWKNKANNGNAIYENISWIDECSYNLTFDTTRMKLNETQQIINNAGGIVVENKSINGNCMLYVARMTVKDNKDIIQEGTICKKK